MRMTCCTVLTTSVRSTGIYAVSVVVVRLRMTDLTDSVSCCITVCVAVRAGRGSKYYRCSSDRAPYGTQVALSAHRVVTLYTVCTQQ